MVIDQFLPVYDISKSYSTVISAPVEKVYFALKNCDINNSPMIRILFHLRGLPMIVRSSNNNSVQKKLTLSDITNTGFLLLDEKQNEEIVIGVVGQFWKLTKNIKRIMPEQFVGFDDSEYAKAAWNFYLQRQGGESTLLTTETRIRCFNDSTRKRFMRYWNLISLFSGLIRKEMLKTVKHEAEK